MSIQDNVESLPKPPRIQKGRYRHYKGNEYEVIGVGFNTETLEPLVIYKPLYDKSGPEFWIRPYSMFVEEILVDGVMTQRFTKISN